MESQFDGNRKYNSLRQLAITDLCGLFNLQNQGCCRAIARLHPNGAAKDFAELFSVGLEVAPQLYYALAMLNRKPNLGNPDFLREAIRLSKEKMAANEGGPFGAVIVKDGEIVGRGWNRVTSANDPTAHAEIMAIRAACTALETFSLVGCEIYASCEPCPMCLSAIYWARLDALFFAASHEDAADAGFDDALLYEEVSKPWPTRTLESKQLLQSEAQEVLNHWKNKTDKTAY